MKSTVYYSVDNCGDGSAYPRFFEDEDCAAVHQNLLNEGGEGWGEDCTGSLDVETDGPVKFLDAMTREEYIKNLQEIVDTNDEDDSYYDIPAHREAIKKLKKKGK